MKRKQLISFVAGFILCLWFGVAFAEPVLWSGNGHYYDVVEGSTKMSWEKARDWASGLTYTDASGQLFKGYLATITSSQEDNFIASLHFTQTNYLLGGYQTPATDEATSDEKKADWHWVTGEKWQYTDWKSGEPNNFFRWLGLIGSGRSEEYLQYFPASTSGSWDDIYTGTFSDSGGEHFFGIRNFVVEYEAEAAASSLMVTVDGVDVNFDWSAMPEANSYVLAVALSDNVGDVDIGTLKFFNMGTQRTFSTAGLPSGMIFYAAILAYTDQGLVVSDMVKFMPFSGTATYFNSGGVLLQVADPGGIGNFTVSGYFDGDIAHLTQISGDDGSGPFTLTLVNEKPAVYTKGDLVLNFTYDAAGKVGIQRTAQRTVSQSVVDCQNIINGKIAKLNKDYDRDKFQLCLLHTSIMILLGCDYGRALNTEFNPDPEQKISANGKLWNMFQFLQAALEGRNMTFQEDMAKLKKQYDECKGDPAPEPNPLFEIDNSCPHPDEAEHWVFEWDKGQDEGWTIHGIGQVGKQLWYVSEEAYGTLHLQREACYASGAKNGWEIIYQDDGNMRSAAHYKNGVLDGHMYDFYEDGSGALYIDNTLVNGVNTFRRVYYEDGSLKMWWDRDEGIFHWTD
jgi:hypothetical protein